MKLPPEEQAKADALKQFVKENKTKWKKEDSLKQLLQFLGGQ